MIIVWLSSSHQKKSGAYCNVVRAFFFRHTPLSRFSVPRIHDISGTLCRNTLSPGLLPPSRISSFHTITARHAAPDPAPTELSRISPSGLSSLDNALICGYPLISGQATFTGRIARTDAPYGRHTVFLHISTFPPGRLPVRCSGLSSARRSRR